MTKTTRAATPAAFAAAMRTNRKLISINSIEFPIRPMTSGEAFDLMARIPGGLDFIQRLFGDMAEVPKEDQIRLEEVFTQHAAVFVAQRNSVESLWKTNRDVLAFVISCCFDVPGDEDFITDVQTWDEDALNQVTKECIDLTLGNTDLINFFMKKFQLWQNVGLLNHLPQPDAVDEKVETKIEEAPSNRKDRRKSDSIKRKGG
ncbi:hypothetical protein ELI15_14185 [Rhizobium ruizarguesonis]|uniref:hypothetical protein n=1 Tax=Rhizobium ruizarguesonis TaxID=2081791 RepID=UPI00103193C0|nr:hypothetical protein [Rhizobium ruizarguesonis]TAW65439.1 hypothetical protein ELI15_14185 [Rhizobium ruizarguesonis]